MTFTFKTEIEHGKRYYHEAHTDRIFNIQDLISHCVSDARLDLQLEGMGFGRIEIDTGYIIFLDFNLASKNEGKGTDGSHFNKSINAGVWGNVWIINLSAMTTSGERHLVKQFKFTQPMLSRYSLSTSDTNMRKEHNKLVTDHLEYCTKDVSSFLKHYTKRIKD